MSIRVLRRRLGAALPLLFMGLLALYAVWPWLPLPGNERAPRTIVFYGFSILRDVMQDEIFPTFQKQWQERSGEKLELVSSFAGSGTITNQIIMGVPAELALLSLELDAMRLADQGVVPRGGWRSLPHHGVVNRTPFIILVRRGNPHGIRGFEDLARPGVKVVHPDPFTSGGANWALLAEYGAGAREYPDDPDAGYKVLLGVWRNVIAQASSARAARTQFENGFGDALVTYEQEALWDLQRGRLDADVVYPPRTVLSEHTLVEVARNVSAVERPSVEAFVRYLWTPEAQKAFVKYGYRSVDVSLNSGQPQFGSIADPFLVEDFGGWTAVKKNIVEDVWKKRVLPEVKR